MLPINLKAVSGQIKFTKIERILHARQAQTRPLRAQTNWMFVGEAATGILSKLQWQWEPNSKTVQLLQEFVTVCEWWLQVVSFSYQDMTVTLEFEVEWIQTINDGHLAPEIKTENGTINTREPW